MIFRVPTGTASEQIVDEFVAMASGVMPAGEGVMDQATYAVLYFIIDPTTSRPHVLDGMVTVFEVV